MSKYLICLIDCRLLLNFSAIAIKDVHLHDGLKIKTLTEFALLKVELANGQQG